MTTTTKFMQETELTADNCMKGAYPRNDEKFSDICKAHLDGVYVFSARENCDALVTHLINQYMTLYKTVENPYPTGPIENNWQQQCDEIMGNATRKFDRAVRKAKADTSGLYHDNVHEDKGVLIKSGAIKPTTL